MEFLVISRKDERTDTMKKPGEPRPGVPETTSIAAAAKRLKIGRNQAYEAAARGELPVIKIGRRYLVVTAALDRMLKGPDLRTP